MKRILAQINKELVQLRRDTIALAMALLLPVILMVLFGVAISLTVSTVPLVVQDLDRSPLSRRYIETFQSSLTFQLRPLPRGQSPEDLLRAGEVRAALIIPPNFERDIYRNQGAGIQILIDATDANTANVVRGSAAGVTRSFVAGLGSSSAADGVRVTAQTRLWYNPGREDRKYIVPGAMVVCLALFPPLLAALATSREKERGTILQVYVSGVSAHEYLLGKIGAFFLLAVGVWLVVLSLAVFVFGLRFTGDTTPFLAGSILFLFGMISFGVMIGARTPNQATAIQAMQLGGFVLSFLLSGFLFPVDNVPVWLRWISGIVPARYYIEIVRDAFLRGGGWQAVGSNVGMLALLSLIFFAVSWRQMRAMQLTG